MTTSQDERARLLESLGSAGAGEARVAIVLGSGLGPLADEVVGAKSLPYEELAGMPASAVPGHAGRLVLGELSGVPGRGPKVVKQKFQSRFQAKLDF